MPDHTSNITALRPDPKLSGSSSPLNRLSWLRPFRSFLNTIIQVPRTRWILLNDGKPLILPSEKESVLSLAYLTTQDVDQLLGPRPYFGQGMELGDLIPDAQSTHDGHSPAESSRHRGPRVVFLGVHETGEHNATSLPGFDFTDPETVVQKLEGTPYFSMDISDTGLTDEELHCFLGNTTLGRKGNILTWSEPKPVMLSLDPENFAVFASAKSMVDWNQRNKFCPGCGSPSYSTWGGWKIACSSLLPWAAPTGKPCFTAKGLHNFMHPRTDGVVMMVAIDEKCDKVLLGRGRQYPEKYYSGLAGFIEPGESFEEAVARETLEEAGVYVWDVKYHSGRPWPYPSSLMMGFYARADSTKPVRLDLDKELIDARWFTRQEVRTVLDYPGSSLREAKDRVDDGQNTMAAREAGGQAVKADEPSFRIPPATFLAGVLIRDWVEGKIGFQPEVRQEVFKGNK